MMGNRGQAYTLEGVIGAILIATAVIFALQAVDVAPWTQGTNEKKVESLRTQAEDMLSVSANDGSLENMVTCFGTDGEPADSIGEGSAADSATQLGPMLDQAFHQNGFRYNVYLQFANTTAKSEPYLVYPESGDVPPADGGVTVTRRITITNNGTQVSTDGDCGSMDAFVIEAAHDIDVPVETGSEMAYVAEVRIVVW